MRKGGAGEDVRNEGRGVGWVMSELEGQREQSGRRVGIRKAESNKESREGDGVE